MNNVMSYLALAYVSQTVARAAQSLLPLKTPAQALIIREWLSTATGVFLAFGAKMDVLGDLGIDVPGESIGYVFTGVILGHGIHYAWRFVANGPWSRTKNPSV